ncbi:MAG: ROK family protein, partial [Pisciglobus halotolerans]|nr:ROK family protein [Pisciglobus halotolerans]
ASSKQIKAIVCNLVGTILFRSEQSVHDHTTSEIFLQKMILVTKEALASVRSKKKKVLGIGVAMHGVVEIESGISLYSSNSGLKNVPIKETMEEEFDLPVVVENNSRAMTIGEYWFGDYGYTERFAAINIGRGVGAGLIKGNNLEYGAQGVAGEIGHVSISLDGEVCSCGNRGCFETFVTGDAIVRRAKEQIKAAPNTLTAEQVFSFAQEGKKDYQLILEETGMLIGIGVINLIHTVNPDKIVLGGGVMKSADYLLPSIRTTIQERALTGKVKDKTVIEITQLGDDATVLGASALLLRELFY